MKTYYHTQVLAVIHFFVPLLLDACRNDSCLVKDIFSCLVSKPSLLFLTPELGLFSYYSLILLGWLSALGSFGAAYKRGCEWNNFHIRSWLWVYVLRLGFWVECFKIFIEAWMQCLVKISNIEYDFISFDYNRQSNTSSFEQQVLYTLGGLENLQNAKKYYASTIDLTGGKNTRALFGICLVSSFSLSKYIHSHTWKLSCSFYLKHFLDWLLYFF